MTIYVLPNINLASFDKTTEEKKNNLHLSIKAADNTALAAKLNINGNVYDVNGNIDIPLCNLKLNADGEVNAVSVCYRGKHYDVGQLAVLDDGIVTRQDLCKSVKVACAAEKAIELAKQTDARLKKIEQSMTGVDIVNLT